MVSLWRIALYSVVLFHFVMLFFNGLAFFLLPFLTHWYIALPLCSFIFRLATVESQCPITAYENSIRRRLGMKVISSFIGHYVVKPLKTLFKVRRRSDDVRRD